MRIELRSPDPACNPYIALHLVLCAGLEGLEKNEKLMGNGEGRRKKLPNSLEKAAAIARKSKFIRGVLPEEIRKPALDRIERSISDYASDEDREVLEKIYFDGI